LTSCRTDIADRLTLLSENDYWSEGRAMYAIEEMIKTRLMLGGGPTNALFYDAVFSGFRRHRISAPARYQLSPPHLWTRASQSDTYYAAEVVLISVVSSRIPHRTDSFDYSLYRHQIVDASEGVI